jgi:hypothetical protein
VTDLLAAAAAGESRTEWAVETSPKSGVGEPQLTPWGENEASARASARLRQGKLLRRTVHVGPWEPA